MEDSNLILTLLAVEPFSSHIFNHTHNSDYYRPPCYSFSRETTPSSAGERDLASGEQETQYPGPRLELTFDKEPKNPERGFTFGSDRKQCDVYLPKKGISGIHFTVTFDKKGQLQMRDTSRFGTWVSHSGQRSSHPRDHFTLVLGPETSFEIDFGDDHRPQIAIKVPKHKSSDSSFQAKRGLYIERSETAGAVLGLLDLSSQATTTQPSRAMSPRRRPWYFKESVIGKGGFGVVYKVVDVSTGCEYAAKMFHSGGWKNEVETLKSVSHEYIVEFVDFSEEEGPLLVMEYLPLGNLACQDSITKEETLKILYQGLQALKYLHSQSPPLAHRDIKPEDILVQSRIPFVIELGDFGLAKNDSIFLTFCGSD